MTIPESTLWQMRHLIYQGFAASGQAPGLHDLALALALPSDEARDALRTLGELHSIFLAPDGLSVLMANPFSAVPTPYRVTANGIDYWANCAWDMLGIPAALGTDATIHATYAADATTTTLHVIDCRVEGEPGVIHFQQPFRHWYEDIRHT